MKKITSILLAVTVLLGAISGSLLQSACVGAIALASADYVGASIETASTIGTLTFLGLFIVSFFLPASKPGMAMLTFTEGICAKVESSLIEIYGNNAPNLQRTQVGYLQALTSPQNTSGMQQIPIDAGNGKIKQVRLKYTQRGTRDDLTTTRNTTCAGGMEKLPYEKTVTIDNYLATRGMTFRQSEMRKLCGPDKQWMAEIVSNEMNTLAEQLNIYLLQNQSSNFGIFFGGSSAVKSVQLLQGTNNNAANFYGESVIMEDLENVGFPKKPLVIGTGNLAHYARMTGIGCCNTLGQDISQAGNMDFFRDRFVGNILGNSNDFIALVPGLVQLLTYNENVGEYAQESPTFSHGTIVDPFTGIKYDMNWHYNDCDGTYTMFLFLNWDIEFIPANAFSAYDELSGFNGTLHYRATSS